MHKELTSDSKTMKKAKLFRLLHESVAAITKSYKHRQMAAVVPEEGQDFSRNEDDAFARAGCAKCAMSSPRCWLRCGDSNVVDNNRHLSITALLPSWITWRHGPKGGGGNREEEAREKNGKRHERKGNPIGRASRSCKRDDRHGKETKHRMSILRPPIRQQYRRGMSGLPVRCGASSGWQSDWNIWVNTADLV